MRSNFAGEMIAAAIADGDDSYRRLSDRFRLTPANGAVGKYVA